MATGVVSPSPARSTDRGGRSLRRSAFAVVAATALLLAGCGTGGDEEGTATTTTVTEPDDASTTVDGSTTTVDDDEPTTTAGGDEGDISRADIESVMPEAADIGPDYRSNSDVEEGFDDDDDEPSPIDDAIEEMCPEAANFRADDDTDDSDKVKRLFETDDDRQIEVTVDPSPNQNFEESQIDEVIAAVNTCGTIEYEDGGFSVAIDLEAARDDSYGDRGVTLEMHAVMNHPELLAPLELELTLRALLVGSVSVNLSAADGVGGATADTVAVIPGDHAVLAGLASQLATDLATLQD